MKEKVMSLAQGKFTYEEPEIVLSTEKLEFDVTEGGEASSVFRVKNARDTKIKGFGAVDDFNIEVLSIFDGKDNEVTVKVHAENKKAGEVIAGDICIVTDCGEKMLPYQIHVVGRYLESPFGKVKSYEEFLKLARENFDEAVSLFYHDKFKNIYLQTMNDKRLYQNLTLRNPKKQALEEFLISHGDKKPLQFMVNKKQMIYEVAEEDISGEIVVAKDSWGMVGIKVSTDCSFLSVDKSFLYAKDFVENQAVVSFHVSAVEVPAGIHRCRIRFENVYQSLEVGVRIHCVRGRQERKERLEVEKMKARMTKCHIQYMMNSSRKDEWLRMLMENREKILFAYEGCELQLDGYISYLSKNEKGMKAFLNAVEGMTPPAESEDADKVFRYLVSGYLKCKITDSEEEQSEFFDLLKRYYTSGYRHWRLLVLFVRLGYYKENATGLLEELDLLWQDGNFTPYMHFYRMMLILQEPEILKQLDSKTTGALKFALKHDLITEDIVIAVSFLAARKKKCTPALLSLLENCYGKFKNKDTLHSICALLIRAEKLENRYFKWFRLGVENRLRLTELFEYYMYTMDKDGFDKALPSVMSYFQYENHLRDSVKVHFYASIVRNREEHPEYFQIYSNAIRDFTLKQLYDHHISKELVILYEAFLVAENIKDRIAKELPYILFAHRIKCMNKNMERVAVVHDEGGGEKIYNLVNGEADINIGTPNYKLYFVDKNGFYHADTVSYQLEKMLNLDFLAENCYENGSEHPILLLHLFSRALQAEDTGAKDAIIMHMMIRNDVPGVEYRYKALLALYEYYRAIGEDVLLEEVIGLMDFKYISAVKRPGILQTMIQHKMEDAALGVLKKYEILNCSPKLLLLLITWKLEEGKGNFDPYYMRLCNYLYTRGVRNKTTLGYLANYYMGKTAHLAEIYRDSLKQETDISDGATERLLGQALFISDNPEKYSDTFLDYYEYGANRVLVKAFLSYFAYEYLVGHCGMPDGILEKIQKESLSEDNHIMIFAMLKYYSGKTEYTDSEKEYIQYHLSRYASTGRLFTFMKEFVGKVDVPFEIEHAEFVSFYCSHKGDIYIETESKGGEKMICPMHKVFEDIYVYEVLLFRGERVSYRIYAGDMENPAKSGIIEKDNSEKEQDMAFYEIVNQMIEAREKGDMEEFRTLAGLYKCRQSISKKLLEPL